MTLITCCLSVRSRCLAVPDDALILVAGLTDVQTDRLEMSIIGIGRDDESWVIDHVTLYGDPGIRPTTLVCAMDSQLFKQYETESGRQMAIRAACVDPGGHFTNQRLQLLQEKRGSQSVCYQGVGGEGKSPLRVRPSKNNVAKCPLFNAEPSITVKTLLFARMRIQEEVAGIHPFCGSFGTRIFPSANRRKNRLIPQRV